MAGFAAIYESHYNKLSFHIQANFRWPFSNHPLEIDCALEAKCYDINNAVGVRQMSRLISRIRYRQFGILITTSYVDQQAYKEVVEDGHPILIVTASDIASILRRNSIDNTNINNWLTYIDKGYTANFEIKTLKAAEE